MTQLTEDQLKYRDIVLQATANVTGFALDTLLRRTHEARISDARHIITHFLERGYYDTTFTVREVADIMCRKRTTIIASRKRFDALHHTDRKFAELTKRVDDEIERLVEERREYVTLPARTVKMRSSYEPQPSVEEAYKRIQQAEQQRAEAVATAVKNKAEADTAKLRNTLSEQTMFCLTYVPFVIIEVAWDYVDTLIDCCVVARFHETKKLCRAMRQLRQEYDRNRFRIINNDWRKGETANMEMFQEELSGFFSKAFVKVRDALRQQYGEIEGTSEVVVVQAYLTHTIFRAVYRYADVQEKIVQRILGYKIASIVPNEVQRAMRLTLEFAGEMTLTGSEHWQMLNDLAEELTTYICDVELNETED